MTPPGYRRTVSVYTYNVHFDVSVKNASSKSAKGCRQSILILIQSILRISCAKLILLDALYPDCLLVSNILRKNSKNSKLKVIICIRVFSQMLLDINVTTMMRFILLIPMTKDAIIVVG